MSKSKQKPKGICIRRSVNKKPEFFIRAIHPNGNILNHSETLKRKQSAFKNIIAAGKIFADVMSGKTAVTDEKGDRWVMQKNGKFKNTTLLIRKELRKPLIAFAKEAAKNSKTDIVLRGPRGGVMLDTRKKSAKAK